MRSNVLYNRKEVAVRAPKIIRRFKRRRRIGGMLRKLLWQEILLEDQITSLLTSVRRSGMEWDAMVASALLRMYRARRDYARRKETLQMRLARI